MLSSSVINHFRRLRADERGATSIIMGILMIPLVGFLALGFEVSNWYMITRGMQNAADASTLAAAINNSANYNVEASAVAAQYGFINGVNNITIAVTNNAACPNGQTNCYSVSISGFFPLLMSQVVGFQGNGNINGSLQKQLNAVAVAQPSQTTDPLCLLALANSGTTPALHTNGAPTGNMNGCDSMSNTAAQCNGHNLGLNNSFAVGANSGCGNHQIHNDKIADPYQSQISTNINNFPADPCNNKYPLESDNGYAFSVSQLKGTGGFIPSFNAVTGVLTLGPGNNFVCGDWMLPSPKNGNPPVIATTNGAGPAVLIFENGQLDLNGNSFETDATTALTLVFTGIDSVKYTHAPTDNSNGNGNALNVLDITPPTTGPWAGMAIIQDPNLKIGVDIAAAGNRPTWDITGLIYTPNATIQLKGAINKSTNGAKCVVMVADNFQISGTGGIDKSDVGNCPAAGLTQPTAKIPGGAKLVL